MDEKSPRVRSAMGQKSPRARSTITDATATIHQLQHYRQHLEDQLRLLQRKRFEDSARAMACMDTLRTELAEVERARATETAAHAAELARLRTHNALLTAAAGRLHERCDRATSDLEALRSEVGHVDGESHAVRESARTLLQCSVSMAEERYRVSERRRHAEVGALHAELTVQEREAVELAARQEETRRRLAAEADTLAHELGRVEAEARETGSSLAREAGYTHGGLPPPEAELLAQTLAEQCDSLHSVADALSARDARDSTERADALLAADRLEDALTELDDMVRPLALACARASTHITAHALPDGSSASSSRLVA
jgi:chromosome segregation ATPase